MSSEKGPWGQLPKEAFFLRPPEAAQAAIDGIDVFLSRIYGPDPENKLYELIDVAEAPARLTFAVTGAETAEFKKHLTEAVQAANDAYGRFGTNVELLDEEEHRRFIVLALF
ncbi:MAG: hypothetical protein RLZZ342_479 [Candidatus Parcubacteria bacterium]|jgi:hypothetical protein